MTKPQVTVVDSVTWAATAATLIMAAVAQTCQACGSCTVMLTGGRTAARLYEAWAASPEFGHLRDVHFYFGDERCVPPDHPESNYGLAMRTLFRRGVPHACTVSPAWRLIKRILRRQQRPTRSNCRTGLICCF